MKRATLWRASSRATKGCTLESDWTASYWELQYLLALWPCYVQFWLLELSVFINMIFQCPTLGWLFFLSFFFLYFYLSNLLWWRWLVKFCFKCPFRSYVIYILHHVFTTQSESVLKWLNKYIPESPFIWFTLTWIYSVEINVFFNMRTQNWTPKSKYDLSALT